MKESEQNFYSSISEVVLVVGSSIDIEVIRTVLFLFIKIFCTKKTQALFKYLNTLKKA